MSVSNIDSEVEPREWHVTAKDGKLGPLTLSQVAELAASGQIAPRSLAWKSGMETWQACGMIPELAAVFTTLPAEQEVWRLYLTRGVAMLRSAWDRVAPLVRRASFRRFRPSRKQIFLMSAVLLPLIGFWIWRSYLYSPPHDEFVSVFLAERADGQWQDLARVEKREGKYWLYEIAQGRWTGPQEMKPMEEKALSELFGEEWMPSNPVGLVNSTGQTAILHAPQGWEPEDFDCSTGYLILKQSGPVQIKKQEPSGSALPTLRAKVTPTPEPEAEIATQSESALRNPKEKVEESNQKSSSKKLKLPTARVKSDRASSSVVSAKLKRRVLPASSGAEEGSEPVVPSDAEQSPARVDAGSVTVSPSEIVIHENDNVVSTADPSVSTVEISPAISDSNMDEIDPAPSRTELSTSAPSMTGTSASSNFETPPASAPSPTISSTSVKKAQDRAATARGRLAAMSAAGRSTLKDQFLKNGDAIMTTSREREAAKDFEGAVFYAERAEATFRQGEQAISGGR